MLKSYAWGTFEFIFKRIVMERLYNLLSGGNTIAQVTRRKEQLYINQVTRSFKQSSGMFFLEYPSDRFNVLKKPALNLKVLNSTHHTFGPSVFRNILWMKSEIVRFKAKTLLQKVEEPALNLEVLNSSYLQSIDFLEYLIKCRVK